MDHVELGFKNEMEEAKRRLKDVVWCDCEEPTFASHYVCLCSHLYM